MAANDELSGAGLMHQTFNNLKLKLKPIAYKNRKILGVRLK
jgi:hypothetical protein